MKTIDNREKDDRLLSGSSFNFVAAIKDEYDVVFFLGRAYLVKKENIHE